MTVMPAAAAGLARRLTSRSDASRATHSRKPLRHRRGVRPVIYRRDIAAKPQPAGRWRKRGHEVRQCCVLIGCATAEHAQQREKWGQPHALQCHASGQQSPFVRGRQAHAHLWWFMSSGIFVIRLYLAICSTLVHIADHHNAAFGALASA